MPSVVEVDVAGPGAAGPDRVGVRVHDGLRTAGGARREHDPERAASVRWRGPSNSAASPKSVSNASKPCAELRGRRGSPLLSSVTAIHFRAGAAAATIAAYCGWVMAATAPRVLGEVGDLGADRLGVRGHRDRAEGGAGEQRQHHLGAVLRVQEHLVALGDAARHEPGREPAHVEQQLRVGPAPALTVAWRPHEGIVVGLLLGPVLEQPGDVLAVRLELLDGGDVHGGHATEPGGLLALVN